MSRAAAESSAILILVVEDDDAQREVHMLMVENCGFQVEGVPSGEAAIDFLKKDPVDLLVLDMVMPGLDGVETYRQALAIDPSLKAIVVSGCTTSQKVKEALKLGASAYLTKPVGFQNLHRAILMSLGLAAEEPDGLGSSAA